MYWVNENKDAKAHFAFFFKFSFCHSYITHMDVFVRIFSATTGFRIMKFRVNFQIGKVYCVNENYGANSYLPFFQFFNFSFCHSYITHLDIFHQGFLRNYLIYDYEIFDNFVFSLKVLQPLMATARGM